jgi:co-chaperonin GroES (HSP10)
MIRPANDYVYVKRDDPPGITQTGLIIPKNAQSIMKRGKVIAVGPGKRHKDTNALIPMPDLKPGDEIIWVQQGVEKWFDEERKAHIFVEEKYILAVVG